MGRTTNMAPDATRMPRLLGSTPSSTMLCSAPGAFVRMPACKHSSTHCISVSHPIGLLRRATHCKFHTVFVRAAHMHRPLHPLYTRYAMTSP